MFGTPETKLLEYQTSTVTNYHPLSPIIYRPLPDYPLTCYYPNFSITHYYLLLPEYPRLPAIIEFPLLLDYPLLPAITDRYQITDYNPLLPTFTRFPLLPDYPLFTDRYPISNYYLPFLDYLLLPAISSYYQLLLAITCHYQLLPAITPPLPDFLYYPIIHYYLLLPTDF